MNSALLFIKTFLHHTQPVLRLKVETEIKVAWEILWSAAFFSPPPSSDKFPLTKSSETVISHDMMYFVTFKSRKSRKMVDSICTCCPNAVALLKMET